METMTVLRKEEIKNNPNFLCGLELEKVSVYLLYRGGQKCQYYMFKDEDMLFEGDDYKPSPLHNVDDLESVLGLLSFLTCQPGDTDDEYFAKYNANQLEWANSHECEFLKGEIMDFENSSEPEYQTNAQVMFNKSFIRA